jgi:hypothetical protein
MDIEADILFRVADTFAEMYIDQEEMYLYINVLKIYIMGYMFRRVLPYIMRMLFGV